MCSSFNENVSLANRPLYDTKDIGTTLLDERYETLALAADQGLHRAEGQHQGHGSSSTMAGRRHDYRERHHMRDMLNSLRQDRQAADRWCSTSAVHIRVQAINLERGHFRWA